MPNWHSSRRCRSWCYTGTDRHRTLMGPEQDVENFSGFARPTRISNWQRYVWSPRSLNMAWYSPPIVNGVPSFIHFAVGTVGLLTLHSMTISAPPSLGIMRGLPTKVGFLLLFSSPPAPVQGLLKLGNFTDAYQRSSDWCWRWTLQADSWRYTYMRHHRWRWAPMRFYFEFSIYFCSSRYNNRWSLLQGNISMFDGLLQKHAYCLCKWWMSSSPREQIELHFLWFSRFNMDFHYERRKATFEFGDRTRLDMQTHYFNLILLRATPLWLSNSNVISLASNSLWSTQIVYSFCQNLPGGNRFFPPSLSRVR